MKIFSLLFLLIGGFLLNMGIYYVNEDYRKFLHNLKYEEKELVVTDEYSIEAQSDDSFESELKEPSVENTPTSNERTLPTADETGFSTIEVNNQRVSEVAMGVAAEEILAKFSAYGLLALQTHSSLFDVTTEYPDKYFEYYGDDITLYFFPTKTYADLKDILYVESDGGTFRLNETNTLGDKSFFINLGLAYDDGNVRLVISDEGTTFGLKISKNQYNAVKQLLN